MSLTGLMTMSATRLSSGASVNWPCYTMVMGWGDPAAKAFNVKATPSMFVIDRAGRIVAKPMDHEELRAFLVKYFNQ